MSYPSFIAESDIIDGLSIRYLKFFGIWGIVNDYRTKGKRNWVLKFQVYGTIFLAFTYVTPQLFSYFVIDVDIQKWTILNLNVLPATQLLCRNLVFWYCLESQCRLFNLLRKDFLEVSKRNLAEVENIYRKISKTSNSGCTWVLIMYVSLIILFISYPVVSVDYILYHTGSKAKVKTGRNKVMGGWYPIPMGETPYYEMMYVYESTLIIWGGFYLQSYFCLFYQVLACLNAQFTVLGEHLSSLKIETYRYNRKRKFLDEKYEDFIEYEILYKILKDHQKLLRYTEELRRVYNPLVTVTLAMGIVNLINGAFQFFFTKTADPSYIIRFVPVLGYQFVEVSLLCYASSSLQTASSDLQFAIYSSDWYKADTKFRKTAQMLMLGSKKGVTLTAIRMYPVNMETLMSIFQFIYTVCTLMTKMTE